MDPIEFKNRLAEFAEVETIKPHVASNEKPSYDIEEVVVQGEVIELSQKCNPTLGVELIKLKDINKVCEMGCGKIVTNQLIEKRFTHVPKPHWKTKCMNCGAYLNPQGDGLIMNSQDAHAVFRNFYMRKK